MKIREGMNTIHPSSDTLAYYQISSTDNSRKLDRNILPTGVIRVKISYIGTFLSASFVRLQSCFIALTISSARSFDYILFFDVSGVVITNVQ